ncbi:UNVERIFIED_CONTAM: hypothetical protein PYX00_010278 [Menopon gallinae]|uniref:Dynactin subunit 2 n=1 Tax=Menopon gallinae TaxID=328185 RepID=A0AAW2HES3_9NEOP
MANPKYAGLPGIAPPDEKDVYETDDLPEADQDPEYAFEVESEYISRPHLDIVGAHSRFKDKTLVCGKGLDFSDRIRRKRNTGYEAVSGDWEIAAEGEKETIFQRYTRLQCEMNALIEDINKMKAESAEEKSNEVEAAEALVPKLEQSLHQLNICMNLSDSAGPGFMQSISDPQGAQLKKLISKLESLKESSDTTKKSKGGKEEVGDGMLTYQLKTFPAQNKFIQTTRLASLEQRLNKLETVIGSSPENLNRLQLSEFKNLSEAAHKISAQINLLDAVQIERIDSKLAALIAKMDSIAEKRGGQELIEKEKKINELYEFLGKSEAINESLKTVTERLIALKSLHVEAAEFKRTLKELEADQAYMSSNISNNEAVLKKIEAALQEHLQVITKNLQAFESRLSALKK